MKKIAVHSGSFHADDVFAVGILRLIYPKLKVIRTRDPEELKKVDARIDVGGKYNPEKNDYDHHQREGAGERDNGILYASTGLIWKHFGKKLVSNDIIWKNIDEKIIQYIDADDSGIKTYTSEKLKPYTISAAIAGFNPPWPNSKNPKLFAKNFEEAVKFATRIMNGEIGRMEGKFKGKEIIMKEAADAKDYIILDEYIPWKKVSVEETDLKFVIYKNDMDNKWMAVAVPKSMDSFENRKSFPMRWGGLMDEELEKVSGVKGAIFCHRALFIVAAKSKKGIIEMVEKALSE